MEAKVWIRSLTKNLIFWAIDYVVTSAQTSSTTNSGNGLKSEDNVFIDYMIANLDANKRLRNRWQFVLQIFTYSHL